MIVADRNVLKASLARGVLEIQLRLVQLYTTNLNAIGTQAALIAGFALTGTDETWYPATDDPPSRHKDESVLEYFNYFFLCITFTVGLMIVSQCTISTLYGPAVALNGETAEAVIKSVKDMKDQQDTVFKLGFIATTSLFLHNIVLVWARRPKRVAAMVTLVHTVVYYFMMSEGRRAYVFYASMKDEENSYRHEDPTAVKHNPLKKVVQAMSVVNSMKGGSKSAASTLSTKDESDNATEIGAQTKARGELWMRQSLSKGGELEECYVVLEKGTVDVYRSEEQFNNNGNPINKQPFQLWKYRLELDARKFNEEIVSATKTIRQAFLGQSEFSMVSIMNSEYDLKEAFNKFRFSLIPKIKSELHPLPAVEFMANDEKSFKLWTRSLGRVIRCLEELESTPSVLETGKKIGSNSSGGVIDIIDKANA